MNHGLEPLPDELRGALGELVPPPEPPAVREALLTKLHAAAGVGAAAAVTTAGLTVPWWVAGVALVVGVGGGVVLDRAVITPERAVVAPVALAPSRTEALVVPGASAPSEGPSTLAPGASPSDEPATLAPGASPSEEPARPGRGESSASTGAALVPGAAPSEEPARPGRGASSASTGSALVPGAAPSEEPATPGRGASSASTGSASPGRGASVARTGSAVAGEEPSTLVRGEPAKKAVQAERESDTITPPAAEASLRTERLLIDAARAALARDPRAALTPLDEHESRFPRGQLSEERDALRIQALVSSNDGSAARQRLEAFRRAYPSSPLLRVLSAAVDALE